MRKFPRDEVVMVEFNSDAPAAERWLVTNLASLIRNRRQGADQTLSHWQYRKAIAGNAISYPGTANVAKKGIDGGLPGNRIGSH